MTDTDAGSASICHDLKHHRARPSRVGHTFSRSAKPNYLLHSPQETAPSEPPLTIQTTGRRWTGTGRTGELPIQFDRRAVGHEDGSCRAISGGPT